MYTYSIDLKYYPHISWSTPYELISEYVSLFNDTTGHNIKFTFAQALPGYYIVSITGDFKIVDEFCEFFHQIKRCPFKEIGVREYEGDVEIDQEQNTYTMEYKKALEIAERVKSLLAPHCERIEIAGSIRREKPEVKDIEIVAIPKPYDVGLFESGIATEVNKWEKVKGELPCKYTQRILPEGIKLDLFFAEKGNWGLIYAIRTGSADYSFKVLASGWKKRGYKGEGGYLYHKGEKVDIMEEKDLFYRIGVPYAEPNQRNL